MDHPLKVSRRHWAVLALLLLGALGLAPTPAQAAEKVVMQEFMVPASDPGIQL